MEDIYMNLFTSSSIFTLNLGDILKFPLIILLIANIFYSLMLVLKVKILSDTVDSDGNGRIKILVYLNLVISVLMGLIATILILLG